LERLGLSQMIYRAILFASSVEGLLNMGVFFGVLESGRRAGWGKAGVIVLFPEGMFWPRRVLERYAAGRRVWERFSHFATSIGVGSRLRCHRLVSPPKCQN